MGLLVEWVLEDPGQSLEVSGVVPTMEVSQWRMSSWICAVTAVEKDAAQYPVK